MSPSPVRTARRPPRSADPDRTRGPVLAAAAFVVAAALLPTGAVAQAATQRTPNLVDGWVGRPGTLEFHVGHRFRRVPAGQEHRLVNAPTILFAVPVPGNVLLGARYSSNSNVSPTRANEWEGFVRWAPSPPEWPVDVAVTGAYNAHPGSLDGELSVALPAGPVRLLGAARAFSNAYDSDGTGWFVGGGVVVPLTRSVALAGDIGALELEGDQDTRRVWGAGLQVQIPTTPHTFSIQVTNTRTATLQGSSLGRRTLWGFEFTVPLTLARILPRRGQGGDDAAAAGGEAGRAGAGAARPAREADAASRGPAANGGGDDEVEVTMTDDLRFAPEEIRIRVGQTVVWRNTTPLIHTVSADPEAVREPEQVRLPEGAEPFDSGFLFPDDTFRRTFTVPGEYVYICIPHDMAPMVGRIVVEP